MLGSTPLVLLVPAVVFGELGLDLVLVVVVVGERRVDLGVGEVRVLDADLIGRLPSLWRKTTLLTRTRVAPIAALPLQ